MLTILAVIPLAVALAMMTLQQRNSRQAGLVTLLLVCAMTFVVPAFHLSPLQLLLSLSEGGPPLSLSSPSSCPLCSSTICSESQEA